jgi:YHS domain-containing protein
MVRDPVCGMMVSKKDPPATLEYKKRTYLFCSSSCKDTFAKEPERFAVRTDDGPAAARDGT